MRGERRWKRRRRRRPGTYIWVIAAWAEECLQGSTTSVAAMFISSSAVAGCSETLMAGGNDGSAEGRLVMRPDLADGRSLEGAMARCAFLGVECRAAWGRCYTASCVQCGRSQIEKELEQVRYSDHTSRACRSPRQPPASLDVRVCCHSIECVHARIYLPGTASSAAATHSPPTCAHVHWLIRE